MATGLTGICVFADGCQLPDDAGLPLTYIIAGGFPATGGGAGAPRHLCICRRLPIARWCRAPCHLYSHIYICRRFANYPVVPWIHGTCRRMPISRRCRAPCHLYICRRFANYPVVPGLPGICIFADGSQLPHDAGLPVPSKFAGGFQLLVVVLGLPVIYVFADGCQLLDDVGHPVTSILYLQAVCQLPSGAGLTATNIRPLLVPPVSLLHCSTLDIYHLLGCPTQICGRLKLIKIWHYGWQSVQYTCISK
jgi:hypothetical protein